MLVVDCAELTSLRNRIIANTDSICQATALARQVEFLFMEGGLNYGNEIRAMVSMPELAD